MWPTWHLYRGRGKLTAGIITPLPQESEEKVHSSAGSCSNTSHSVSASPSVPNLLSQLAMFSFYHFSLSLSQIKHSLPLPLPPPPRLVLQHTAAKLLKKKPFKKKRKSHASVTVHSHLIELHPVDLAVSFAFRSKQRHAMPQWQRTTRQLFL